MGGLFGESKNDILSNIDSKYLPVSLYLKEEDRADIYFHLETAGLDFPLIFKPDVGERGHDVVRIETSTQLSEYLHTVPGPLIIQEYVTSPVELGVLYYRIPGQEKGKVTSITVKRFMNVRGDGINTVRQLMRKQARSYFQIRRFEVERNAILSLVPEKGEELILEPIGNHCLGTQFLSGNSHICEDVHAMFDKITSSYAGFNYGRFDLKIPSMESLKSGDGIRIFEVNGVTSEPGHIYDPEFSLIRAYKDTIEHMGYVFRVSRENIKQGFKLPTTWTVVKTIFTHFGGKKKAPETRPGTSSYIYPETQRIP